MEKWFTFGVPEGMLVPLRGILGACCRVAFIFAPHRQAPFILLRVHRERSTDLCDSVKNCILYILLASPVEPIYTWHI